MNRILYSTATRRPMRPCTLLLHHGDTCPSTLLHLQAAAAASWQEAGIFQDA
jgi:hypothetical protein